ncbi:hypothetical protein [Octadecabacter ascidiaceicola]|uniref:hypothetical protein n=1 Tax=Octadecabacter ascidiaceicola TaxID=1655543 RepID=UPI0011813549|nr:hypothetical protein [Octadecabacter ascidiaceicola]
MASALGNFTFLIGLEAAEDYIFSLSLSSFSAGVFGYAILPNLVFKLPLAKIINLLLFLTFCAFGLTSISSTAGFVLAMILTFVSAEIILSAHEAWRHLILLRITMMISGVLSWVQPDGPALIIRAFLVAALVFWVLGLVKRASIRVQGAPKIASLPLLSLVATNLIWVYILPLFLITGVSQSEQKVLYIAATVFPLLYFKAQDVVFKLDILARANEGNSPQKFLLFFATPLALLYCVAPIVQAIMNGGGLAPSSVIFSALSLGFLFVNYWLTSSLQMQSFHGAKKT